jgi:hypothetical protein
MCTFLNNNTGVMQQTAHTELPLATIINVDHDQFQKEIFGNFLVYSLHYQEYSLIYYTN